MRFQKIPQQRLSYLGNCIDLCEEKDGGNIFEDANDMQQVVEQDDITYSSTTFFIIQKIK